MTDELITISKQIRKEVLAMAIKYNDGHIAPAYSIVEILVALYKKIMDNEDKFVLSKGHGCLSYYAVLEKMGYNPTYCGHPNIDRENGIFCTTGSLGLGLPIALGKAFAKKFKNEKGHIFVLIGDGECQEGTIWESLNLAKKLKLDNLTIIVDQNGLQALTTIKEIIDEDNLIDKFRVFGCNTIEINGHNFEDILNVLDKHNIKTDMPKAIFAKTVKGKGLSFMENVAMWHSKIPTGELLDKANEELK